MTSALRFLRIIGLLALSLPGSTELFSQAAPTPTPTPFAPGTNSLFYPGTNVGAADGYYGEWQLKNLMPPGSNNAGLDVDITGAWSNGITGAGVVIGIIDDGIEGTHPDLNFTNAYSWDFAKNRQQNLAATNNDRGYAGTNSAHGTATAGVAAGTGNGIGTLGAAPGAQVASLQYYTAKQGFVGSKALAQAILFEGQKNASGNPDPNLPVKWSAGVPVRVKIMNIQQQTGYIPPSNLVMNALALAASNGVITTAAAGNFRSAETGNGLSPTGNTEKSEFLTSPNLIVVAALGSDGQFASYSGYGANVFVTAPTSSQGSNYQVAATDLTGTNGYNFQQSGPDPYFTPGEGSTNSDLLNYTSTYGGTSEADPLVGGIMALGVQANTNMSLRLAQHLLALTSLQVDPGDSSSVGGWITNAAGYKFDNNYGFGLVNATAFTTAAANVAAFDKANNTNALSPLQIYKGPKKVVNEVFASPKIKNGPLSNILNVNYDFKNSLPLPIEYVQIHITLSGFETNLKAYENGMGAIAGDISGTLTSPSGTTDQLFSSDSDVATTNRTYNLSTLSWTFLSYAYYGEQLNGPWTLKLVNNSTNTVYKTALKWSSFSITVGTGSFDTNAINPVTQSIIVTPTILGSLNTPQLLAAAQPDTGTLPGSPLELTAVPEPSETALILMGICLMALLIKYSIKKRVAHK
jgi:hypothetical protein